MESYALTFQNRDLIGAMQTLKLRAPSLVLYRSTWYVELPLSGTQCFMAACRAFAWSASGQSGSKILEILQHRMKALEHRDHGGQKSIYRWCRTAREMCHQFQLRERSTRCFVCLFLHWLGCYPSAAAGTDASYRRIDGGTAFRRGSD